MLTHTVGVGTLVQHLIRSSLTNRGDQVRRPRYHGDDRIWNWIHLSSGYVRRFKHLPYILSHLYHSVLVPSSFRYFGTEAQSIRRNSIPGAAMLYHMRSSVYMSSIYN